jgi:hypothetical protein
MPSIINSDDGVVSGTSGLKTTGANDGILALQNNGTTNVTVTSSGNVGLGTASPAAKLQIIQSDSTTPGTNQVQRFGSFGFRKADTGGFNRFYIDADFGGWTECAQFRADGLFQFNSGYGSSAAAYGCRAWVNFSGTGTVTIRASGNVSSITDNGVGDYTVNFTTAMPDVNYAVMGMGMLNRRIQYQSATFGTGIQSTTACSIRNTDSGTTVQDDQCINVAIFR